MTQKLPYPKLSKSYPRVTPGWPLVTPWVTQNDRMGYPMNPWVTPANPMGDPKWPPGWPLVTTRVTSKLALGWPGSPKSQKKSQKNLKQFLKILKILKKNPNKLKKLGYIIWANMKMFGFFWSHKWPTSISIWYLWYRKVLYKYEKCLTANKGWIWLIIDRKVWNKGWKSEPIGENGSLNLVPWSTIRDSTPIYGPNA